MSMFDILAPFDYPRQSAANFTKGLSNLFTGDATTNDLIGMAPGLIGGVAGGMTASPLIGALAAGAAHGLGRMTGLSAFDAPSTGDVVEKFGGDRNSWWQNMGAQIATDPLTFATAAVVPGVPSFSKLFGSTRNASEKMAAIAAAHPDDLANELRVTANILGDIHQEFPYVKDPARMMALRADLVDDARRITSPSHNPHPYYGIVNLSDREKAILAASDHIVRTEKNLAFPFDNEGMTFLSKNKRIGDISPEELRSVYRDVYTGPRGIDDLRGRDQFLGDYITEPLALRHESVHPAELDKVLQTMASNNYPTVPSLSARNRLRLRQTRNFPDWYSNPNETYIGEFADRFPGQVDRHIFGMIDGEIPNELTAYYKYFYPGGVGDDYTQLLKTLSRNSSITYPPLSRYQYLPEDTTTNLANYLIESLVTGARPSGPLPGL